MPQEAEKENEEEYQSVIVSEVTEVVSETYHGIGIGVGTRECREVEELAPWTESGSKRGGRIVGAGCEGEIRGGGGGTRLTGGGDAAVCCRGGFGGHWCGN